MVGREALHQLLRELHLAVHEDQVVRDENVLEDHRRLLPSKPAVISMLQSLADDIYVIPSFFARATET